MSEQKGAVVGVFLATRKDMKPGVSGETKLVETLMLKRTVAELKSSNRWKAGVMRTVEDMGYEVISSPSFLRYQREGCDIIVTVMSKEDGFAGRKAKPVTRGGRAISKPVTGKKTMATLRRNQHR